MRKIGDKLQQRILSILSEADEPMETKEIELKIKTGTRTKILYRLNNLRGESRIKGKAVGSGKGTWIWWVKKHLEKNEE